MAGLRDVFDSTKGMVERGFDVAKQKTAEGAEAVAKSLRGAPATPAAAPEAAPSFAAKPAYTAAPPADEFTKLYDPARLKAAGYNVSPEAAARAAQSAAAPQPTPPAGSVRSPSPYGDAFRARPSAEAQAFRASGAGNPSPLPPSGARGVMSRVASGAGTVVGGAAAGSAMMEAGKQALAPTPTEDIRKQYGLPATSAVGRGLRSIGVPESAAQFGDDLAVRLAGVWPAVSNAATFGLAGMAGDAVAQPPAPPAQPPAPPAQPPAPPAQPPAPDARFESSPAGLRAPADIIKNRGVADDGSIIPEGTGAFKVGSNPARGIDTRGARGGEVKASGFPSHSGPLGGMGAFIGQIANVKAAQARDAGAKDEAELGIKNDANRLATARLGMEIGEKNRKTVADRVKMEAGRELYGPDGKPVDTSGMKPEELKAAQEKQHANVASRLEYSLGQRADGKSMENATPAEVNQLLMGEKFKRAIDRGRGDKLQYLKDFFGNSRHDSDNVYSYLPAYRDGNRIYTHNGNSVAGSTAAGGEFQFPGPNTPVDADMMRHIRNLPSKAQYEAAQKKGK